MPNPTRAPRCCCPFAPNCCALPPSRYPPRAAAALFRASAVTRPPIFRSPVSPNPWPNPAHRCAPRCRCTTLPAQPAPPANHLPALARALLSCSRTLPCLTCVPYVRPRARASILVSNCPALRLIFVYLRQILTYLRQILTYLRQIPKNIPTRIKLRAIHNISNKQATSATQIAPAYAYTFLTSVYERLSHEHHELHSDRPCY